jgi:hypothetical protein
MCPAGPPDEITRCLMVVGGDDDGNDDGNDDDDGSDI